MKKLLIGIVFLFLTSLVYEQVEIFLRTKSSCDVITMDISDADLDVSEEADTDNLEENDDIKYQPNFIENYLLSHKENTKKNISYTLFSEQITPFKAVFSPPPELI